MPVKAPFQKNNEIALVYVSLTWSKQPVATSSVKFTYTQLLQLDPGLRKVIKKLLLVLGVLLNNRTHLGILDQREIGREHHQATRLVLVLKRSSPRLTLVSRLGCPFLFKQETIKLVGDGGRSVRPLHVCIVNPSVLELILLCGQR
jgi:hypothetical protein